MLEKSDDAGSRIKTGVQLAAFIELLVSAANSGALSKVCLLMMLLPVFSCCVGAVTLGSFPQAAGERSPGQC